MLNIEQVVTLLNAGFSADEIRAMEQRASAPVQPAQDPASNPTQPAQDPASAPAQPVQDPAATPAQPVTDMAAILQRIAELTAAVQANGIANSQQPKQPDRADVLASIILPNK